MRIGSIQDFARKRMALQVATYGQPVKWRGATFDAVVSDVSTGRELGVGGFQQQHDLSARLPREDDAARPNPGETLRLLRNGRDYRIDEVIEDPAGVEWVVGLCNLGG